MLTTKYGSMHVKSTIHANPWPLLQQALKH